MVSETFDIASRMSVLETAFRSDASSSGGLQRGHTSRGVASIREEDGVAAPSLGSVLRGNKNNYDNN